MRKFHITPTCLFLHLFGNKGFEGELLYTKSWQNYFHFDVNWSRRTDHAGISLMVDVCWFSLDLKIYDYRHWNYEENCWESYCTVCEWPLEEGVCTNTKCEKYSDEHHLSEEAWNYLQHTLNSKSIFTIDPRQMALLRKLVNDYPIVAELVDYHDYTLKEDRTL